MQRILFLCLVIIGVIFGFMSLNETTWLKDERRDTIIVSVIYDGVVEKVELEPYTSVGYVLSLKEYQNVDYRKINLERILSHRDVLAIPSIESVQLISINTGTIEELVTLKGVGEKLAQSIIDYRDTVGLFKDLDDLKHVKGMGSKKFDAIVDLICL